MKTRVLYLLLLLSCLVPATLAQDVTTDKGIVVVAVTRAPVAAAVTVGVDGSSVVTEASQGAVTAVKAAVTAATEAADTEAPADVVTVQPVGGSGGGKTGATEAPATEGVVTKAESTAAPGRVVAFTGGTVVTEADSVVTGKDEVVTSAETAARATTQATSREEEEKTTAPAVEVPVIITTQAAETVTQAAETVTSARIWPDDDPCSNHTTLKEDVRHYTYESVEGKEHSDKDLEEGWYAFTYKDEAAIITPVCIKEKFCSTYMPYHLKSDSLPEIGETIETQICGPGTIAGETSCCLQEIPAKIRNCQTKYIFYLEPVRIHRAFVCVQLPEEEVPIMYHAIPVEGEEPLVTTAEPRPTLPSIHYSKLSSLDGVVTVEFEFPEEYKESNYMVETFDPMFRKLVAEQLNNMNETVDPSTAPPPAETDSKDDQGTDVVVKTEPKTTPAPTKPPTKKKKVPTATLR